MQQTAIILGRAKGAQNGMIQYGAPMRICMCKVEFNVLQLTVIIQSECKVKPTRALIPCAGISSDCVFAKMGL